MEIYHNTTNENKETVKTYRKLNAKQDKRVLAIIKNERKPFSSSLIWKRYLHKHLTLPTPITSIRRSINTLKNLEYIIETGNRVPGLYQRSELEYRLLKK